MFVFRCPFVRLVAAVRYSFWMGACDQGAKAAIREVASLRLPLMMIEVSCECGVRLHICGRHAHKTLCHAAQSVVEGRCPVWLGPDLTWTTSKVGTLMFDRRAPVMKNVPHFLRGAFRNCLRLAMEEACQRDTVRCERGWKLFMLMQRMLLHRPPRGGNIPRHKLQERFDSFGRRQWAMLLRQAIESVENITIVQRRGHRQQGDDLAS